MFVNDAVRVENSAVYNANVPAVSLPSVSGNAPGFTASLGAGGGSFEPPLEGATGGGIPPPLALDRNASAMSSAASQSHIDEMWHSIQQLSQQLSYLTTRQEELNQQNQQGVQEMQRIQQRLDRNARRGKMWGI